MFQRNVVLKFYVPFLNYWLHKRNMKCLYFVLWSLNFLPGKVFQENNNWRALSICSTYSIIVCSFHNFVNILHFIHVFALFFFFNFTTLFTYFSFLENFWSQIRLPFFVILWSLDVFVPILNLTSNTKIIWK